MHQNMYNKDGKLRLFIGLKQLNSSLEDFGDLLAWKAIRNTKKVIAILLRRL